jgi:hypothetical protein
MYVATTVSWLVHSRWRGGGGGCSPRMAIPAAVAGAGSGDAVMLCSKMR